MYVSPSDLADLDSVGTSEDRIVKLIEKAETRLRIMLKRRGVNLTELAGDEDMLPVVRDVLENAVLRVLRNPDGARSESEGDYSITHNPLDSAGNIWFPVADLALLAPSSATVGTIRLGIPAHRLPPESW